MSSYPKIMPANLIGMQKETISHIYENLWNDSYVAITGIIIHNYESIANVNDFIKDDVFKNVKKIVTKFWADDVMSLEECDRLHTMLLSVDSEDFLLGLEVIKHKLPDKIKVGFNE